MVQRLRELSLQRFAGSVRELRQMARRVSIEHTEREAKEALSTNVGKQILAPKPRFKGVAAAEGPGSRLQADLADFHNPAKDAAGAHHFALVLSDVYTRQTWATPMRYKDTVSTNTALKQNLKHVKGGGENAVLTTDSGKEFSAVDKVLEPLQATHRLKEGRNDISIVDRAMQTLKIKLANARANLGGKHWSAHLGKVTEAYNSEPRAAVHGPPDKVAEDSPQGFLVLQDNARKFAQNREVTNDRLAKVRELGAVREAVPNGARGFKPGYGPVRKIKEVLPGAMYVLDEEGDKIPLKQALAVDKDSKEPLAVFDAKERKKKGEGAVRKRAHRPMVGKIPEAASRVFEEEKESGGAASSSSSGIHAKPQPAVEQPKPEFIGAGPQPEKSELLRARFGGAPAVRTMEEQAAYKAEAARKKAERDKAAKEREAARKAREKAKDDEAEAKRRAREEAKEAKQKERDAKKKG